MNEISTNIVFTEVDKGKLKLAYPMVTTNTCIQKLVDERAMVKVGDVDNLIDLYNDFVKDNDSHLTFNEYVKEVEMGYGSSDYLDIARLLVLSNGIWYDNEYC